MSSNSPAGTSVPTCEQITQFATQLVDIGITVDFDPTEGPAHLADRVDVVLHGVLTGSVTSRPSGWSEDDGYLDYEFTVTEILRGQLPEGRIVAVASVPYYVHHAPVADYADAAVPDIPVVVFGNWATDGSGSILVAIPEGFVTACDEGPLRGFVGTGGAWPSLSSLDDVMRAVPRE
jgi:hypothetical protein